MPVLIVWFLLAAAVKNDATVLRTGCEVAAERVATLAAGTPLAIRFALSGESVPCFKVAVEVDGKLTEGYLPDAAINGLEEFERGRQNAAWLDATQVMGALRASDRLPSLGGGGTNLSAQAAHLIESSQPAKALEILEPALKKQQHDPNLLALAGIAAWRSDEPKRALEYWRGSIALHPNPDLERLVHRVERETQADQSSERIVGMRVVLRYDAAAVPVETARQMTGVLDEEFGRVAAELGCRADERVIAIAQTREAYRKSTDAAEWSGGQFDGRIRVPLEPKQSIDGAMRRVLAHEITHACLAMVGRWPAWLQEGLAQKLSGDTLPAGQRQKLAEMSRAGKLPRLSNLGQDWSRMDSEHARAAYGLALAAAEILYENYHQDGVRNLIRNPERLAAVTADLDKRLGL
jgi:tetratricopeptide (TPR) repeat protein